MDAGFFFEADSDGAVRAAVASLARYGLLAVRSFDLRSALADTHSRCECPHHGTDLCTCQYVVLLVYAERGGPLVLTAHTRECRTEIQIVQDGASPADGDVCARAISALLAGAVRLKAAVARPAAPAAGSAIA